MTVVSRRGKGGPELKFCTRAHEPLATPLDRDIHVVSKALMGVHIQNHNCSWAFLDKVQRLSLLRKCQYPG